jgi:hypothetical protein
MEPMLDRQSGSWEPLRRSEKEWKKILVFSSRAKFHPAEEYHQGCDLENPLRNCFHGWSWGQDDRLMELWGSPT